MANRPRSEEVVARDAARLIRKSQELGVALCEDEVTEIILRAIREIGASSD